MRVGCSRHRDPTLQGWRILIVEDEPLVAMTFEDTLLDAGAEIIGLAGSVEQALLLIEAAVADGGLSAAVPDIDLQGAAVSPIADHLAARGVPFVCTMDYGEDCDRGPHAAAPILAKPFGPDTLVDAAGRARATAIQAQPPGAVLDPSRPAARRLRLPRRPR